MNFEDYEPYDQFLTVLGWLEEQCKKPHEPKTLQLLRSAFHALTDFSMDFPRPEDDE